MVIVTRRSVLAAHLSSTGLPVSIRQGLVDVLLHSQKEDEMPLAYDPAYWHNGRKMP